MMADYRFTLHPGFVLGLLLTLLSMGITACDSSEEEKETPGTITVRFTHSVSDAPFELNGGPYRNAAGNPYEVSLLEYIMSDFKLIDVNGNEVLLKDTHYGNAADASTASFSVPLDAGDYRRFSFTFGLAGARNTPSALPNIESFNNMIWPGALGGGYHYMRLEGRHFSTEEPSTFQIHTGPTQGLDNSVTVERVLSFLVNGNNWEIEINMDVNEWLEKPNVYNLLDFPDTIMPVQLAQRLIQENGNTVFTSTLEMK